MGCAFRGVVPEIEISPDEIVDNPPDWFIGTMITGLFDWR